MNWCILRKFFVKVLWGIVLSTLVMVLSYGIAMVITWMDEWWCIIRDVGGVFCLVIVLPVTVTAMLIGMYREARNECSKQE